MRPYYKIIDVVDSIPKFLYHGVGGVLTIPWNKWLIAKKKKVFDGSGGTKYLSGFHVFCSYEDAVSYLRYFRKPNKRIATVFCKGVRKKAHSRSPVYLVDEIKFVDMPVRC